MEAVRGTSPINRWAVLAGSVAVLLCTGVIYSFSVFAGPLASEYHWTMAQVMVAFAINGAIGPIPMILGGFIVDRGWARISVLLGGLLFTSGFMLAGAADTLPELYLSYGVLAGLGQGFAYSGCLSNTVKLFPDRRGMAAGIVTGGMGAGTVFGAPVAARLIEHYNVSTAFVAMGAVYTVVVLLGVLLIRVAPVGYTPPGWSPAKAAAGATSDVAWTAMMRTPAFYLIFAMLGIGAFSGLMIASQASPIGRGMFGLSAASAAGFVSLYSACNAIGRIAWGTISDRLGYVTAIVCVYAVVAASMLLLVSFRQVAAFAAGIVGLGLCFGGVMGVFPALVMKNFGARYQGINYGITFCAYSLAAFFAPRIAASLSASRGGDYTIPFVIAIVLALVGIGVAVTFAAMQRGSDRPRTGRRRAGEPGTAAGHSAQRSAPAR